MARQEETRIDGSGKGKVLFVPNMEPYCVQIMSGVFRTLDYEVHVLREDDKSLALGMKHTGGGECIPCPSTTGALIKAMEEMEVPPERAILFMPTACGPCRFGQYVKLDRMIFEKKNWSGIQIMSPSAENAYEGLPTKARINLWHALLLGDIFRKLACRVRPYEKTVGAVDEIITRQMAAMEKLFSASTNISAAPKILADTVAELVALPKHDGKKPLVGIVGEIFVRSDPYINGDLIRRIEALGGEAWLAPFAEWIFYTMNIRSRLVEQSSGKLRQLAERARSWLENNLMFEKWEKRYYAVAEPLLSRRREYPIDEVVAAGQKYLPWQFEGEAIITLGRAKLFVERDGAKAIVNASPMFCMPGTVTSSIFPKLEKELGVTVINNFYDGSGDPNKSLAPVMHYLSEDCAKASRTAQAS
jgi:predicted nucleotide-binding protein (sugar kinase/HSP70/actin superfamily)